MKNLQRREKTRSRILKSAGQCFAREGYDRVGVAEICRQAGVSKGAFYYHFKSKQQVLMELLDIWLAKLEQGLAAAADDSRGIPETLLRMSGMIKGLIQSDFKQAPIFLELWTQASRDETVRQQTIATYTKYRQIFTGLITRGIDEGSLAGIDPVSGAQVILSLASGIFLQSLLDPEGADWEKVAGDSIQIMLDGLKRR